MYIWIKLFDCPFFIFTTSANIQGHVDKPSFVLKKQQQFRC